jgi:hypothetical protein
MPIAGVTFPASLSIDVVGAPPDVGRYITADDSLVIPATMRLARLSIVDDVNRDGAFAVDAAGTIVPPDRLIALAGLQALLFVETPPSDARALDAAHAFLPNWELAGRGYHLVQLDGSATMPDSSAHVVAPTTRLVFTAPSLPVRW